LPSIQTFSQGSCGTPYGTFYDDDQSCTCMDLSFGVDCVTFFMSIFLDCPCTFPDDYADANSDGNCYNNLAAGTYCFVFTQPASGFVYTTLITNNCVSCNSLTGIGGNYDGSHGSTHGCGAETFDKDCNSLGTGIKVGTGNAGIAAGDIITYCITVPAACSGAMDICPVSRCDDLTDCGEGTSALPIKLTYMKTERYDEYVSLVWKTGSEVNNDYFSLERRPEGQDIFETVAQVNGMGNSSVEVKYEYKDYNPYPGTYYYRLHQTDYDGKINYVGMAVVHPAEVNNKMEVISIFPNPATDNIRYELNSPKDALVRVEVLNGIGEQVLIENIEATSGSNSKMLNVTNLSQGVYILKISTRDEVVIKKFIKS